MAKFTYIAQDAEGKKITAVAEAVNRQALLLQLKESGLTVFDIRESQAVEPQLAPGKWKLPWAGFTRKSVPTEEMALFWRQFSTMVAAGLPVITALEAITEELDHPYFKTTLEQVIKAMWDGQNFSQGLSQHSRIFPLIIVALVAAAEESGSMPSVAQEIANLLENRDRLVRKVKAALTYPIFLCGFFFCVVVVATFWIIPMFRDIYASFKAKLPILTEVIFSLNQFILDHVLWILAASVILIIVLIKWSKSPRGEAVLDHAALRVPVFGKVILRAAIARFARSLAVLIKGGVPITRALEMVANATGSRVLAGAVQKAREEILKGNKIAESLKKQKLFPRMVARMISVGEETGNLTAILEKIAEFYESQVDAAVMTVNALIEPIIIVMIGCFVLVFVMALYLPIFSLAMSAKG